MSQRETLRIFETEDEIYDRVMSAVDRAMEVHKKNNPPKVETPMTDFESWWYYEGSAGPNGMGMEEHCKRMCQIAWSNGAFKAQEAAVRILQDFQERTGLDQSGCIEAIRKGDEDETNTA